MWSHGCWHKLCFFTSQQTPAGRTSKRAATITVETCLKMNTMWRWIISRETGTPGGFSLVCSCTDWEVSENTTAAGTQASLCGGGPTCFSLCSPTAHQQRQNRWDEDKDDTLQLILPHRVLDEALIMEVLASQTQPDSHSSKGEGDFWTKMCFCQISSNFTFHPRIRSQPDIQKS